jgi:glycosyltransferase involved in cell wall biosynthesis
MGKVGLLLPAYNEEKNIQTIISDAKRYLPGSKIVVIDDGSKDRTAELASKMGAKVLNHGKNRGKGEALKTGFKYFLNEPVEFVVVCDTDGQYKIRDAVKIIDALENRKGDFVTGYRNLRDIPFANREGNFIWKTLFNFLFGTNLKDIACGFIGLNKTALKKISNFQSGYTIESSMLLDCIKNKLKIFQVPISVSYGKRKITNLAKMFFMVLFFIFINGMKYRFKKITHYLNRLKD